MDGSNGQRAANRGKKVLAGQLADHFRAHCVRHSLTYGCSLSFSSFGFRHSSFLLSLSPPLLVSLSSHNRVKDVHLRADPRGEARGLGGKVVMSCVPQMRKRV